MALPRIFSTKKKNKMIASPTALDVVYGSGIAAVVHPGNKAFRSMVRNLCSDYRQCKGNEAKKLISKSIVQGIRSKGGRFLMKESDGWYDSGDKIAIEKTSQAFRDYMSSRYAPNLPTRKEEANKNPTMIKNASSAFLDDDKARTQDTFICTDVSPQFNADFSFQNMDDQCVPWNPEKIPSLADLLSSTVSAGKDDLGMAGTTELDVAFRSGNGAMTHPGNKVYRDMVKNRCSDSSKYEKREQWP